MAAGNYGKVYYSTDDCKTFIRFGDFYSQSPLPLLNYTNDGNGNIAFMTWDTGSSTHNLWTSSDNLKTAPTVEVMSFGPTSEAVRGIYYNELINKWYMVLMSNIPGNGIIIREYSNNFSALTKTFSIPFTARTCFRAHDGFILKDDATNKVFKVFDDGRPDYDMTTDLMPLLNTLNTEIRSYCEADGKYFIVYQLGDAANLFYKYSTDLKKWTSFSAPIMGGSRLLTIKRVHVFSFGYLFSDDGNLSCLYDKDFNPILTVAIGEHNSLVGAPDGQATSSYPGSTFSTGYNSFFAQHYGVQRFGAIRNKNGQFFIEGPVVEKTDRKYIMDTSKYSKYAICMYINHNGDLVVKRAAK